MRGNVRAPFHRPMSANDHKDTKDTKNTKKRDPLIVLVPKLCLGTVFAKLCFAETVMFAGAKRSFADGVPKRSLGTRRPPHFGFGSSRCSIFAASVRKRLRS